MMIPTRSANAKSWMTGPPTMSRTISINSVVEPVRRVLLRVSLTLRLMISMNGFLRVLPTFSRIRS